MNTIRVTAVSINTTPLDWDGNTEKILQAITAGRNAGSKIICLPELGITGYGCEDAFLSTHTTNTAMDELLNRIVPETKGLIVAIGLPIAHHGALYNCVASIVDGKLIGFTAKRHLAGDGIHYEGRWFKPWPEGMVSTEERNQVPIGDIHFNLFDTDGKNLTFGYEICEDAWVAARPGGKLAAYGVDLILNPSASHFAFGKIVTRERFVLEGSRAFNCGYVYSNLAGNEAGRVTYDGGNLIASCGQLLARGPRLQIVGDVQLTTADLDIDLIRTRKVGSASHQPRLPAKELVVNAEFNHFQTPNPQPVIQNAPVEDWETGPYTKFEEFVRSETLALYDYNRKAFSNGYALSLSGGLDSAVVALLIKFLVERLALKGITIDPKKYLTSAYQATRNSSEVTETAARKIAEATGCEHHTLDVDHINEAYLKVVGDALGINLTWKDKQYDLAMQNSQARTRSPSICLIANIKNQILLCTSNRSEAAVGYCTMDGDTSGGLSPISGVSKAFLRKWAEWVMVTGPEGLSNVPALKYVLDQSATAELRPLEEHQTDEADLMPYPILEEIETEAIGNRRGPADVLTTVQRAHPNTNVNLVAAVIKFFTLWTRNQWKRERYAPGFHVDDKNLDPRSWCRFPILSGGFRRELKMLKTLDKK